MRTYNYLFLAQCFLAAPCCMAADFAAQSEMDDHARLENQWRGKWASSMNDLVHEVVIIGRESRREIPASMRQKLAATGSVTCNSHTVTAQLTHDKRTIVMAGHVFFDADCNRVNRGEDICKFAVATVGVLLKEFPVAIETLKTGNCPLTDRREDWAVLKLRKPMLNIIPYEIPDRDNEISEPEPIIQISGFASNFLRHGEYPRTIESCNIRAVSSSIAPIKHDCDTGKGASGSAQFVTRNGRLIFAAMNVSEVKTSGERMPYDPYTTYNISTPVSGAFLQAIRGN